MNAVKLGQVCRVTTGQPAPNPDNFSDQGTPFIRAGSLKGLIDGKAENSCELLTNEIATELKFKVFPEGTIIFAKSGMSAKLGRVYQLKSPAYLVSHLAGIIPTAKVYSSYLRHWFLKNSPACLIANDAYPSIRTSEIANIDLVLPPLSEQKRIAAILDQADAIRRKRQDAIELVDTFLRSVFLKMFGDPVTNPMGWDEALLEDVSVINSGVTKGKLYKDSTLVDVPYMRVANVQDGWIDMSDVKTIAVSYADIERYLLMKGDLLLTEGGDPDKLGRGAVWDGSISPCIHQNHIFKVRFDTSVVIPEFASFLIGSTRGKRYFLRAAKQTTGIATINKTQLSKFEMLVPGIKKQKEFVSIVQAAKTIREKLKTVSGKSNKLFSSLQQRAFRRDL